MILHVKDQRDFMTMKIYFWRSFYVEEYILESIISHFNIKQYSFAFDTEFLFEDLINAKD